MTDKERLEEIRKHETIADNECGEYEHHKVDFYYEHVGWLIEQAERVQNLKEIKNNAINQIDVTQERNKRLEERVRDLEKNIEQEYNNHKDLESGLLRQNKCYREAIERIKKYANDCIDVGVEMNPHLVLEDIKELEEYYNE